MNNDQSLSAHPSARIPILYAILCLIALGVKTYFTFHWAFFELTYRFVVAVGGLYLIYLYVARITSVYEINALEVSMSVGIFSKKRRSAPINRVTNFEIDRPFLKRLLGLADLHVDTAGGNDIELQLAEMNRDDAEAFSRYLTRSIGLQKIADADGVPELRAKRQAALAEIDK